jgi:hypothetical protein
MMFPKMLIVSSMLGKSREPMREWVKDSNLPRVAPQPPAMGQRRSPQVMSVVRESWRVLHFLDLWCGTVGAAPNCHVGAATPRDGLVKSHRAVAREAERLLLGHGAA